MVDVSITVRDHTTDAKIDIVAGWSGQDIVEAIEAELGDDSQWEVVGHEGFGGWDPTHADLDNIAMVADTMHWVGSGQVVAEWIVDTEPGGGFPWGSEFKATFQDRYEGRWDTLEAFAADRLNECAEYARAVDAGREHRFVVSPNVAAWAKDYYRTDDGHVFSKH